MASLRHVAATELFHRVKVVPTGREKTVSNQSTTNTASYMDTTTHRWLEPGVCDVRLGRVSGSQLRGVVHGGALMKAIVFFFTLANFVLVLESGPAVKTAVNLAQEQ